jgi:hypothetical protein
MVTSLVIQIVCQKKAGHKPASIFKEYFFNYLMPRHHQRSRESR